ncbi:MAG: hypothetical protein M0P47_12220 [Bacteroidales bacterium]|nr:hypothetical protein [Bacteroidales bacterium]
MIRRLFVVLFVLVPFIEGLSQQVELMFTVGMASYSMRDLKNYNSGIQLNLPFNTQITSNFPTTPQIGGHFAVQISHFYKLGVLYAYSSTGSRITASDYSGYYHNDIALSGHTLGIINSFYMVGYKALRVDFQTNIGMVMTDIRMTEELHTADTTVSDIQKYSSLCFFVEPKVEATYQWKLLKTGLYVSYFVNPGGKIKDLEGWKTSSTTSWSGFRFGIEIGIGQMSR